MRRSLLCLALLLLASACGGPQATDVRIEWTFGGQSCSDAGVTHITVDFGGASLSQSSFDCPTFVNGVDLGRFAQGSYEVLIKGFDANNNAIYLADVNVDVTGATPILFPIDLDAQVGSADLRWTFGGLGCDAAGVKIVNVFIDGAPLTDVDGNSDLACNDGGTDGVAVDQLFVGAHAFEFFAQAGSQAYAGSETITIQNGVDAASSIDLAAQPAAASALVSWTFSNTLDCTAAGVDTIDIILDPNANGSGGTVVGTTSCVQSKGGASFILYDISDGTHSFGIRGSRGGTLTYYTHSPVSTVFAAPDQTDVTVDAEPTP
jgi:hypothetical protein